MEDNLLHNNKDLLSKVADGDALAFRQLFDHYRNKIYSLGMYLTKSETLAEEIVQDVFLKVWEKRAELIKVEQFNSWLRRVAKNICSNYLRDLAVEKIAINKLSEDTATLAISVESEVMEKEYRQILVEALQRLSPQQKKVYILSRQDGKKQDEIAKELNISLYTVKEYLKLAQRSVRKYFAQRIDLLLTTALLFYLK